MAIDHYENFPVASFLMPANIRQDVVNLYRFARYADDIADEGDALPAQRLRQLRNLHLALNSMALSNDSTPLPPFLDPKIEEICGPLAVTIRRQKLPISPLSDLLSAFEQDIQVQRYPNVSKLLDYCNRSANPVGRLMLHLFKHQTAQSLRQSDQICTALQLINFLQDVAIDFQKGRIYLPQDEMVAAGVSEQDIATSTLNDNWRNLMQLQVNRCRSLLKAGRPLGKTLSGRIGLEMRLIVEGGGRVLDKIEALKFDVFHQRPTLNLFDWLLIIWRAIKP